MRYLRQVRSVSWLVGGAFVLWSAGAVAQVWSTNPSDQSNMVYQQYAATSQQWITVAQKYALSLFKLLASIEFSWTAIVLALEGQDLQGWVAKLLKKMMTIGFFYALLLYGQEWMGAIIQSFVKIGTEASGSAAITPSEILMTGLALGGKIAAWSIAIAAIPGVGTSLSLFGFAAALLLIAAYVVVVVNFIVTTIESFVVLGAGFIFLGLGGSRWTVPYVERYVAIAASVGVRLMVLYMIIGLGVNFGNQWLGIVSKLGNPIAFVANAAGNGVAAAFGDAVMNILGVLCGAVTYAGIALAAPKIVASVLSGSLSMGGSDAIGMATGAAVGAATVAAGVASAGASTVLGSGAGLGGGMLSGGAQSGMLTGASPLFATSMGTGTSVPPPPSGFSSGTGAVGSQGTGSGAAVPPPPPSAGTGSSGAAAPPSIDTSSAGSGGAVGVPAVPESASGSNGVNAPRGDVKSQPIPGGSGGTASTANGESSAKTPSSSGGETPSPKRVAEPPPKGPTSGSSSGAGGSPPIPPPNDRSAAGAATADSIRTVRDEVSKVLSHLPEGGGHAPPPQIKLDHGE